RRGDVAVAVSARRGIARIVDHVAKALRKGRERHARPAAQQLLVDAPVDSPAALGRERRIPRHEAGGVILRKRWLAERASGRDTHSRRGERPPGESYAARGEVAELLVVV